MRAVSDGAIRCGGGCDRAADAALIARDRVGLLQEALQVGLHPRSGRSLRLLVGLTAVIETGGRAALSTERFPVRNSSTIVLRLLSDFLVADVSAFRFR